MVYSILDEIAELTKRLENLRRESVSCEEEAPLLVEESLDVSTPPVEFSAVESPAVVELSELADSKPQQLIIGGITSPSLCRRRLKTALDFEPSSFLSIFNPICELKSDDRQWARDLVYLVHRKWITPRMPQMVKLISSTEKCELNLNRLLLMCVTEARDEYMDPRNGAMLDNPMLWMKVRKDLADTLILCAWVEISRVTASRLASIASMVKSALAECEFDCAAGTNITSAENTPAIHNIILTLAHMWPIFSDEISSALYLLEKPHLVDFGIEDLNAFEIDMGQAFILADKQAVNRFIQGLNESSQRRRWIITPYKGLQCLEYCLQFKRILATIKERMTLLRDSSYRSIYSDEVINPLLRGFVEIVKQSWNTLANPFDEVKKLSNDKLLFQLDLIVALLNSTDIIHAALCIDKIPEIRPIKDLLDKIHDLFATELIDRCDIHQMLTDPGYFEDLTLQEQFSRVVFGCCSLSTRAEIGMRFSNLVTDKIKDCLSTRSRLKQVENSYLSENMTQVSQFLLELGCDRVRSNNSL